MTRGESLVGILVAVAVVLLLALAFTVGAGPLGGSWPSRADGEGKTLVGRSKSAARDIECRSNLSQLRTAIQIATDPVDGARPATLEETKLGHSFYECPVGGEAYKYDPGAGRVACQHKGHETY
jgi:hypothetical protein